MGRRRAYGKVLLAPGQRLGYLAVSPLMPMAERQVVREAFSPMQIAIGWSVPNAVMQYSLPDFEDLSIDIDALTRRRDRLTSALTAVGAQVLPPEGTFYLWCRWTPGDPEVHWNRLADHDVFVIPGRLMAAPDWFRISLTASDAMPDNIPIAASAP